MLVLELSSKLPNRFSTQIERSAIGATFNVMANLTRLDKDYRTGILTTLPNDGHGQFICEQIRQNGVDNSNKLVIMVDDLKLQTAYMCTTLAHGMRGHKPIVRRHSDSMANLTLQQAKSFWNFDALMKKTSILHLCLHELGLNPEISDIYQDLILAAKRNDVTVIVNLNFRKGLFPDSDSMTKWRDSCITYAKLADILIGNKEKISCDLAFPERPDITEETIVSRFPNIKYLALTGRDPVEKTYSASLFKKDGSSLEKIGPLPCEVIYPIGSGDAFDAGLINGLIKEWSLNKSLRFAVDCARDNLATLGDLLLANEQEIYDWLPSHTRT